MDRDLLQSKLIQQMLEDMDLKTMMSVLYDFMDASYDKYSEEELKEEIQEYYPDLFNNEEEAWLLKQHHKIGKTSGIHLKSLVYGILKT